MMEFFYNLGLGILEHKDEIIMFLTSGSFVSLIVALINLRRASKDTKENTKSTNSLNSALLANQQSCEDSATASLNTANIINILSTLTSRLDAIEAALANKMTISEDKLNAIIEVQSIVYSTIKDEKVRNTVNSLLINAKYAETTTRTELKKQVEDLKKQVAEKAAQLADFVDKATGVVTAIVDGGQATEDKQEYVPERY